MPWLGLTVLQSKRDPLYAAPFRRGCSSSWNFSTGCSSSSRRAEERFRVHASTCPARGKKRKEHSRTHARERARTDGRRDARKAHVHVRTLGHERGRRDSNEGTEERMNEGTLVKTKHERVKLVAPVRSALGTSTSTLDDCSPVD